jgi:hypothetical protein
LFILTCTPWSSVFPDQDVEYSLNLEHPERNQGGIFPVVARDIDSKSELIDKLTLYLPILDIRDYKDHKYKAGLLGDFSGVVVKMPSVPNFLFGDVAQMHNLEAVSNLCVPTQKAHKVHGYAINANELCQVKEITYKSPKGMTCTNKHFNEKENGGCSLVNSLRLFKAVVGWDSTVNKEIKQKIIFCYWQMPVDGETRRIEETSVIDTDGLGDVLQGMLI